MDVPLRPELERFIDEQVKAGHFCSAAEVVEAGLARLMLDPEPDALDAGDRAAIEESEQQLARGEDLDWQGVRARLRSKYLGE